MSKESEQIARIQKGLKCSEEEAREIYLADCAIDKGEKMEFDLSREQAEVARKFAHTGTRKAPMIPNLTKRERKPNATKGGLIAELAQFLGESSGFEVKNVEIVNKERMISFSVGENRFELTLVQKRAPKK